MGKTLIWEKLYQSRNPTEEKLTGLSYKLSDLKKWAEIDDWNTMTDDIIDVVKPDGSPEYMYYDEFEKKILDGELEFLAPSSNVSRMRNMRKMQSMQRTICHWNRKLLGQKV